MLHIICTGSQGSGKSTLIKELKKIYPDFIYQKEFVRAILKKSDVNRADYSSQRKILDAQKKFLLKPYNSISDKCSIYIKSI